MLTDFLCDLLTTGKVTLAAAPANLAALPASQCGQFALLEASGRLTLHLLPAAG